jgi:hypothetical protein
MGCGLGMDARDIVAMSKFWEPLGFISDVVKRINVLNLHSALSSLFTCFDGVQRWSLGIDSCISISNTLI